MAALNQVLVGQVLLLPSVLSLLPWTLPLLVAAIWTFAPRLRSWSRYAQRFALGAVWLEALLVAKVLAEMSHIPLNNEPMAPDDAWTLPLAAALGLTVVASLRIRRWLPESRRRVAAGLLLLIAALWLVAKVGPLGALLVLAGGGAVALAVVWVLVVPRRLAPPLVADTLNTLGVRDRIELGDARLKLQNDLRSTALQTLAAVAVLAGAVLAFEQLAEDRRQATVTQDLTRQGQTSERFTRAINQLESDRAEVQLGGIYGLAQIAHQAPDNRLAVREVLVAYLHRRSPRLATVAPRHPSMLRLRAPDVQAALSVLVRLEHDDHYDLVPLDLSGLDLSGAEIRGETTLGVNNIFHYRGADLSAADLQGTDLRRAVFYGVHLDRTDFSGADLSAADFSLVNSEFDSHIGTAKFSDAVMDEATDWGEIDPGSLKGR
ncbi:pentapeptide repeat-containing protein [Kribbella sp. NPDC026611]|uniref:pentapeptide repeat-containing protein n=1 Tax=Kribbella sp. NPDC026611 TaxID=3154911 RepID=UPI003409EC84